MGRDISVEEHIRKRQQADDGAAGGCAGRGGADGGPRYRVRGPGGRRPEHRRGGRGAVGSGHGAVGRVVHPDDGGRGRPARVDRRGPGPSGRVAGRRAGRRALRGRRARRRERPHGRPPVRRRGGAGQLEGLCRAVGPHRALLPLQRVLVPPGPDSGAGRRLWAGAGAHRRAAVLHQPAGRVARGLRRRAEQCRRRRDGRGRPGPGGHVLVHPDPSRGRARRSAGDRSGALVPDRRSRPGDLPGDGRGGRERAGVPGRAPVHRGRHGPGHGLPGRRLLRGRLRPRGGRRGPGDRAARRPGRPLPREPLRTAAGGRGAHGRRLQSRRQVVRPGRRGVGRCRRPDPGVRRPVGRAAAAAHQLRGRGRGPPRRPAGAWSSPGTVSSSSS